MSSEEIYKNHYRPIHDRLVSGNGLNFDFLALTILHEHIEDSKMLISELVNSCLSKIENN